MFLYKPKQINVHFHSMRPVDGELGQRGHGWMTESTSEPCSVVHSRQERMDCMCMSVCAYTGMRLSSTQARGQGPVRVDKATLTHDAVSSNVPKQCARFGLYTNRDGRMLPECWLSLPFTLPE